MRYSLNSARAFAVKLARAGTAGVFCALILSFMSGLTTSKAAFSNDSVLIQHENIMSAAPGVITVSAPTVDIVAGTQFDVFISFSNVPPYQVNSWDNMVIRYDPAVLGTAPASNFGCSTAGTLAAAFGVFCNEAPAGALRDLQVSATNGGPVANDVTSDGPVLKIHFTALGPIGSTSALQVLSTTVFLDPIGVAPTTTQNGSVHLVGTQAISVITPPPPASTNYGDTFVADATGGGSGNPVTVTTSGPCSGGNGNAVPQTITMTSGSGVCSVIFDQAASANYLAAPQVTRTVNASPRPITIKADPKTKVYGMSDPPLTFQITSGSLVPPDTFSGSLTRAPGQNVGTYTINQGSVSAGSNYVITYQSDQLTITPRPVTVTATAGQTKVYGAADPVFAYTFAPANALQFGDTFVGALSRVAGESVGGYAITIGTLTINDGNGGLNYALTFVSSTFQITPKAIFTTASASSKIYDGSNTASATCSLFGVNPGDTVNCSVTSATFDTPNVGTNKTVTVNVSLTGPQAGNYTVTTPVFTTADITPKALTATASAVDKVYDGNNTASATCTLNPGVVAGDTVNCVVSSAAFADANVGVGKTVTANITLSGASAGNYTVGTPVTTTASITPKPLTAAASASNKIYDGSTTASATCSLNPGVLAGDTVNCSVTSASFATPAVGTGKTVTVNVSLSGSSAGNYSVTTPVTTTADITPKALTATASASNKVYDGNTTAAATCGLNPGVVAGDTVTCNVTSATFNTPGVGTAKPVTVNISLGGASAGNYTVTTPVSTSADITARPLTAVASASDKVYDGNTTATATCSIPTGVVAGDTVNCVVTSASFATAAVGTGKTVTVNVTISGASAGNYTVGTPVTTTASITARPITVTADPKTKVYLQSDPPLTYQLTSGTLVAGDNVTGSLVRDLGENVGSYNINQGSVTAGPNYALTYVGAAFTITQAAQAITITMPAPASAVVNSSFNVAATGGGSGNPVVITGSGACAGSGGNSVGGSQVTITMVSGVGTCHITYDQTGDTNYSAAPQLSSDTTAINQATVQLASSFYADDESQSAQIIVTRSGDDTVTTTVQLATSVGGPNPATAGTCGSGGADYQPVSTTVTFAPTVLQQTVPVVLCKDMLDEPLETANITISSPTNGVLGAQTGAGLTINDTANQFTSISAITFATAAPASPYPSTINVVGAPTVNGGMRVTLYDLQHASPGNIDILLVGPLGQKMMIMGDAGGSTVMSGPSTLTFQDSAGVVLPQSSLAGTGKYEPTTWVAGQANFAAPAPAGPYAEPGSSVGGTPSFASVFGQGDPNGQWKLFVRDDGSPTFAPFTNQIAGGWGLQFNVPTASGVSISGRVLTTEGRGIRNAKITVTGNSLALPITAITGPFGNYTVNGLQAGETYVITVGARRFSFAEPSRVITLTDNLGGVDFTGGPLGAQ